MPVPKSHSRHHQRSHLHFRERRSQPWEWENQITTIPNNPQTWIKNPNPGICDSDSPMACLQRVGSEAKNKKMNGDPKIHGSGKSKGNFDQKWLSSGQKCKEGRWLFQN
ncbi:hypothetical protein ACFX13_041808 [Malus domestica]|uniref:Uncharacterized protein n=1 Tax=Malus domestica TaxID=3750 RepID=A0A498JGH1_MALDO|nr:hypothetical protein DVH24_023930 [Malus domestica]